MGDCLCTGRYWALRCCVAPLVEALMLVDRALYLDECGAATVSLVNVFDKRLSPRSVAIVAVRT